MRAYHDEEFGRKKDSDAALFEKLCLESFQAGLSWRTVLHKRDAFRAAFRGFVPARVAAMTEGDVEALMQDARLIRNRRKLEAAVHNARQHAVQFADEGSFVRYVYGFSDGDALCRDLKRRGYHFIGPVMCASFLQSVGALEGHETRCFLHGERRCPHRS